MSSRPQAYLRQWLILDTADRSQRQATARAGQKNFGWHDYYLSETKVNGRSVDAVLRLLGVFHDVLYGELELVKQKRLNL